MAIASETSCGSSTSERPFWPCRSGALTTSGGFNASSPSVTTCQRGWGTPACANRSRWRSLFVASAAVAGEIGCGKPSFAATRAATATGQSVPGEITPSGVSADASRSIAGSSSVETMQRLSASGNPGAAGSRSTTAVQMPCDRAASSSPSCAGPAPRTRRRGLLSRGCLATMPHCRDTTRRCAPGPRRTTCGRASEAAAPPCRWSRRGDRPARAAPRRRAAAPAP